MGWLDFSLLFLVGAIPDANVRGFEHNYADRVVEGISGSQSVSLDDDAEVDPMATKSNLPEASFHGYHDAAISQIIVLPMMILGVFFALEVW